MLTAKFVKFVYMVSFFPAFSQSMYNMNGIIEAARLFVEAVRALVEAVRVIVEG